ncbi:unnamed protein product (macronuclear) [Paramecium tetraurelia]|uniref:Protein kinase domain-containing protein n=1 Tax=Paramecium tetraurelia TaxID=5888 RepID=A0E8V7_PARTE|nr:uncharacterized protein GSPATT00024455001 [Paramecium tetraurelia]CAK91724.1 unnamed protein product [Paramecium tetraurelia]|eukprot:XP_001459121.1 hypothetical protein (macronuclear) [Paramecium tetraurelia strain d4-2]
MQIANYQIELPISLDFSYQLLYRGFDETKQSYYITIFPKSELDSHMYENLIKKIQLYPYIKDAIEDDNNLLISYSNSNNWIKMPPKITNDQFNAYLKQLYTLYSLDTLGIYDFNPDFLYIDQKTVYTIDFGLRYSLYQIKYQQRYNNNYKQDQYMKTWMFGSLLYCLTTGTQDPSYLIKQNQQQINYHIEYNCRQNNLSEENIHFLKILLQVDYDKRPAFDQLSNLFQLQQTQVNKMQSQTSFHSNQQRSIKKIDNLNENAYRQISKSTFTQSCSKFVPTLHHNKIKMALKQNFYSTPQKDLKQSKINQYQYASQLIKSNLSLKHGQIIKNLSTTKSFYNSNQTSNNKTNLNEQYQDNTRSNQQNLSLNIDAINQSRSTSFNIKSIEQQSNAQTNQMVIKQKQQNNLESNKKPKMNQLNSFEQDLFYKEEDDEDDFIV